MKFKYFVRSLVVGGVLSALVLTPISPASAAPKVSALPSSTTHEQVLEELNELRNVQTVQEMRAVEELAAPGVLIEQLVEPDGRVSATLAVTQPGPRERVYWESPGCSLTGACITFDGGKKRGYNGTGSLAGSWPRVTRVVAGNRSTGLWVGRTNYTVFAGYAKNYQGTWSASSISRA